MKTKQLGNRVMLIPELTGYLIKHGSWKLHRTMIVSANTVNLWSDATQQDVDTWNERKERNDG